VQNPYVLSVDPCRSSSDSAILVAANLVAIVVGIETDGSILCPTSFISVVGIKPTVGLTSRAGVIPVSPRQDTIGGDGTPYINISFYQDIEFPVLDEPLK
jgi:amidase